MTDRTSDNNRDDHTGTGKKLDDLYKLIDGIEIAMFTTRRGDGHLVSRPMATQERVSGTDLWFVTDVSSHKLDELELDAHVNLSYYNLKSREWVSVAGTATITQDRNLIEELYKPDWKAWFGTKPRPVVLFEVAEALVTGTPPRVGEQRTLTERELHTPAAHEAR